MVKRITHVRGKLCVLVSDMFTGEDNDIANQSVDTLFFTSEKNRMTHQPASLARRDYLYLDAF